jgi:hypothetical protein
MMKCLTFNQLMGRTLDCRNLNTAKNANFLCHYRLPIWHSRIVVILIWLKFTIPDETPGNDWSRFRLFGKRLQRRESCPSPSRSARLKWKKYKTWQSKKELKDITHLYLKYLSLPHNFATFKWCLSYFKSEKCP